MFDFNSDENNSDISISDLAGKFISLGGGSRNSDGWAFGCEFGFFQRHSGIEPINLLRWASVAPECLCLALETNFDEFDDIKNIILRENTSPYWGIVQTHFNVYSDHSGFDKATIPYEEAIKKVAVNFKFLKRLLIEDLISGNKIFVYRCYDHIISDTLLNRMQFAMKNYGDSQLLYVAKTIDIELMFKVERRSPNILFGWIDHFAPKDGKLEYNDHGWEKVCRSALKEI